MLGPQGLHFSGEEHTELLVDYARNDTTETWMGRLQQVGKNGRKFLATKNWLRLSRNGKAHTRVC